MININYNKTNQKLTPIQKGASEPFWCRYFRPFRCFPDCQLGTRGHVRRVG